MKKEFTQEMLEALKEAKNSVKGTNLYYKFDMPMDTKNEKGRWVFAKYYSIPHSVGIIKTFKEKTYIITNNINNGYSYETRYEVIDEVKRLLNI